LTRTGHAVTLVPVAAILVSGIRLAFHPIPPVTAHTGCASLACDVTLRRGEEMGWFEHGSTIIVLAPAGFSLCDTVQNGSMIRMGERLMRVPHLR
jgi:phosphatidylserine decarboxylase